MSSFPSATVPTGILRFCIAAASGFALAGMVQLPPAYAGSLNNFINDLYGGRGIVLFSDDGEEFFTTASLQNFSTFNSGISSNVGLTALASAVAGTAFDVSRGMPIEVTQSLGSIVGERAETLGAGRFDVSAGFSRVEFTRLNNQPLNQLQVVLNSPAANSDGDQVVLNLNVKLIRELFDVQATYGLTSRWDVGIIVPLVHVTARATSDATINHPPGIPNDDTFITPPHSTSGGDATGLGDVILRTKYTLLRDAPSLPDFAFYGQINLPTGSESDLLGTGNTDVLAMAVLSKQLGAIAPHLNIGYQQVFGHGLDTSNLQYVVGADASIIPTVTVAVDVVGRRLDTGLNLTDFAVGAKWNVFGRSIVSANFLVPINRSQGLRPDYAWTARWEMLF
jgi:outer membrane putative beta-barrel porin/alpha-amylase